MLNNLTIGIPFHSRGSKIRIDNLISVLKHIEKLNTNIIVFEQDDKIYLNETTKQYPNIIFHFEYKKEDYFDRTKIINNIISITKTKVYANCDADVILPLNVYKNATKKILDGYDFVIPYNGKVFNVSNQYKIGDTFSNKDYLRNECAIGGIIFNNTETYKKIGMDNKNIKGWGWEDFERLYRFYNMGTKMCYHINRPDIPFLNNSNFNNSLYHFNHDHERNENSNKNPHRDYNKKIFEDIKLMKKNELTQYIKNKLL